MTHEISPAERLYAIVEQGLCIGCGLCQAVAGGDRVRVCKTQSGYEQPVVQAELDHDTVDRERTGRATLGAVLQHHQHVAPVVRRQVQHSTLDQIGLASRNHDSGCLFESNPVRLRSPRLESVWG